MPRLVALFLASVFTQTLPAADGRVIRGVDDPDQLYYVGADHKRYPFPHRGGNAVPDAYDVHATWYVDRSEVVTVSRAELERTALGHNVTVRPASVLLAAAADGRVYVPGAEGVLREIAPDHAARLFGADWRNHAVLVPDVFFVNYLLGSPYDELIHPDGLAFRYAGGEEAFLLDGGSARPISPAMLTANGIRPEHVFTIPDELRYPLGASVDRREERLTTPAGPINLFSRGEVDGLPPVNLTDAVTVLSYLFIGGSEPGCLDAADVDDSGGLNLTDAVALLQFLFMSGPTPAYPGVFLVGNFLDFDPTPDSLPCGCFRCDQPQLEVQAAPLPTGYVLAGARDATIGRFTFRLRGGQKVTLQETRLQLTLSRRGTSTATLDSIRNVRLLDDAGVLVAGPADPRDQRGETVEDSSGIATLTDRWTVGAFPRTLDVIADLDASLPAGDLVTVAISPTLDLTTALPALLGPTSTVAAGPQIVAANGVLVIQFSADTAAAGLLPGQSNNLAVGDLLLQARGEDVAVERLDFTGTRTNANVAGGAWGQLRAITLYHLGQPVARATPVSDGGLTDVEERRAVLELNPPLVVTPGTTARLIVTVDTERVSRYGPTAGPGYAGQGFILHFAHPDHVRATGQRSATRVTADVTQAMLPAQTVCVTVPTVTANDDLPASIRLGDRALASAIVRAPIYRFQVAADLAADLALYQNCLRISVNSSSDVHLDRLLINDGVRGDVAVGDLAFEQRDGSLRILTYRFLFTNGGAKAVPLTVTAGQTVTLTAYADVTGFERGSVMLVQLLGDDGFPAVYPVPAATVAGRICFPTCGGSGHFTWSDFAYSGPLGTSDPRLLMDSQWYNGHRVRTSSGRLPAVSHPLVFRNE